MGATAVSATAVCNAGEILIGGGFQVNQALANVYATRKAFTVQGDTWIVYARDLSASGLPLTAYAHCLQF